MYSKVTVDRKNKKIIPRESGNSYSNIINEGKITTSSGKKDIVNILDNKDFGFPKPKELIKYLLRTIKNKNIVFDFFAGSGTTAHAIMDLNLSEKENIKFITTTKKYDFMGEKNG
jgi:adenine-specific DNA-methyltransferase